MALRATGGQTYEDREMGRKLLPIDFTDPNALPPGQKFARASAVTVQDLGRCAVVRVDRHAVKKGIQWTYYVRQMGEIPKKGGKDGEREPGLLDRIHGPFPEKFLEETA